MTMTMIDPVKEAELQSAQSVVTWLQCSLSVHPRRIRARGYGQGESSGDLTVAVIQSRRNQCNRPHFGSDRLRAVSLIQLQQRGEHAFP